MGRFGRAQMGRGIFPGQQWGGAKIKNDNSTNSTSDEDNEEKQKNINGMKNNIGDFTGAFIDKKSTGDQNQIIKSDREESNSMEKNYPPTLKKQKNRKIPIQQYSSKEFLRHSAKINPNILPKSYTTKIHPPLKKISTL